MRLADIFTDNMVIQRDQNICIFGSGCGRGSITFCGQTTTFSSDRDCFRVCLPPQKAGGPFDMTVTLNKETFILHDILVGDVYIAAGQSNMELTLRDTCDIKLTNCQQIRYYREPHSVDCNMNITYNPGCWQVCNSITSMDFSAIAYYFALKIFHETGIAVGLISCNMGASRVDSWTAPDIVSTLEYQKMIEVHHPDYSFYPFNTDSWLFKNKLTPIIPFAAAGVLWYQGESNRCHEEGMFYDKMLTLMIENWRSLWNYAFPFYCVQLAPYNESPETADWAIIRKQQVRVSKAVPDVYLVTLPDTQESDKIHPEHKQALAEALANAVLNVQFGYPCEYSGPILERLERTGNMAKLTFSHANKLYIHGEKLEDTYVFDKAGKNYPVCSEIKADTLILTWDRDIDASGIRMGYCNNPKHNLYNSFYLASPFEEYFSDH